MSLQYHQRLFQARDGTKYEERYYEEKIANIACLSVVEKVEGDLQHAADTGHHCNPEVDLSGLDVRLIFIVLCPDKSGQEVMPGINLAH